MALHLTPEQHDADPPAAWVVRKVGRKWALASSLNDCVIEYYNTKKEAEAARQSGHAARLYNDEGRWFRGEPVRGWKPYQR